jgi:hypothetical protein
MPAGDANTAQFNVEVNLIAAEMKGGEDLKSRISDTKGLNEEQQKTIKQEVDARGLSKETRINALDNSRANNEWKSTLHNVNMNVLGLNMSLLGLGWSLSALPGVTKAQAKSMKQAIAPMQVLLSGFNLLYSSMGLIRSIGRPLATFWKSTLIPNMEQQGMAARNAYGSTRKLVGVMGALGTSLSFAGLMYAFATNQSLEFKIAMAAMFGIMLAMTIATLMSAKAFTVQAGAAAGAQVAMLPGGAVAAPAAAGAVVVGMNAALELATVPKAEKGGLFRKHSIIQIAEKEPELVTPLSKMNAMRGNITVNVLTSSPNYLEERLVKTLRIFGD